jgi:serine protease AprX
MMDDSSNDIAFDDQISDQSDGNMGDSDKDAIVTVVSVVSALLIFLASSVAILHFWSDGSSLVIGGPSSALVAWQNEYMEITGISSVEGLDGSGVVVCVVDTGIDLSHPDLENVNLIGWLDAINNFEEPYDDEGHGTAMSGIIVADGGLDGVAKGVELLIAKAIGGDGSGSDDTVSESVNWCVENNADIISLSLGGGQGFGSGFFTTDALEQAVEDAMDEGVYVIAAAGNDGSDDDGDVESPGSVEDVICVGGINRNSAIWSGSSKGDNDGRIWPNPILPRSDPDMKPEIVAPGNEVPVLMAGDVGNDAWWGWSSGTSASTAWVAGSLAILLEHEPGLQRENSQGRQGIEEVKIRLMESSQMMEGQTEHDDHYGYGHIRLDLLIN